MSGCGNGEPGNNTNVIPMPRLHLFLCLKFSSLFILYSLVPNLFEDEEKRKQEYYPKEGIGEVFHSRSTQNIMTKDRYIYPQP